MKRLAFIFILALPLLAACGSADPCGPGQIEQHLEAMDDIETRFWETVQVADSTPRISLPTVITELQDIRSEARDLEVPDCAAGAHDALIDHMDAHIDEFLAFLADEDFTVLTVKHDAAQQARLDYVHEFNALRDSAGIEEEAEE